MGRFLTQDSFLGNVDQPPSLHRYAYGWDRPTFYVDPTGHEVKQTGVDRTRITWDEFGRPIVGAVTAVETETVEVKAYSDLASAVAADLDVNLTQPMNGLATRGLGGVRAVGGGAQVLLGAAGLAAPEPTMVTKVAGGVAIAHGIDDIQAGIRQALTGEVKETLTGSAIRKGAEKAGASPETAALISASGEFVVAASSTGLVARGIPAPQRTVLGRMEPEAGAPPPRPSWQTAELDSTADLRDFGFKEQKSYLGQAEVPYGTKGSVRPDLASENLKLSVDVKNYNVTTAQGRYRLVKSVVEQAKARASELPAQGMRQGVIIDIRGQNVGDKLVDAMVNRIVRRSGGLIEADNIVVRR